MEIIKIQSEELNENKYKNNCMMMNATKETGTLLFNESKFLSLLFLRKKDDMNLSQNFKKYVTWIERSQQNKFYNEAAEFNKIISETIDEIWDQNIKKVVFMRKEQSGENYFSEETSKRFALVKNYVRSAIKDRVGSSEKYHIIQYKNAEEFKQILK